EISLAQPSVDARAHLDADDRRYPARASEPAGEVGLAEPALADQPFDAILNSRLRAREDLHRMHQVSRSREVGARRHRESRRGSRVLHPGRMVSGSGQRGKAESKSVAGTLVTRNCRDSGIQPWHEFSDSALTPTGSPVETAEFSPGTNSVIQ